MTTDHAGTLTSQWNVGISQSRTRHDQAPAHLNLNPRRKHWFGVDAFITDHQDRGDLVFQKRVDRDCVTEELLGELHTEAVALFAAFEGHAVRIMTTPSCVVDEDKNYVFAATPTSKRRLLRRRWHRIAIVELAEASGFTREGSGRLLS